MSLSPLYAVSPVDGRYHTQTAELSVYFSEAALIKYRVWVEVEYFIALYELPLPQLSLVDKQVFPQLRHLYESFGEKDALAIKEIEKTTNHDIKAVEYFLRDAFEKLGLSDYKEFIHFGLTSQDINNTAIPYSLKMAVTKSYLPLLHEVILILKSYAHDWKAVAMLARTHGQPASPTRLGKEIQVFIERVESQLLQLQHIPYSAKFGGATGNFNAHYVAYPKIDWPLFANEFVSTKLGLQRSQFTTQIEHYDNMAALFDVMKRINTIIIDLNRDLWQYISMDYFKQKIKAGEVGSSAMPHKVNPIDFENSEGNLGIANAVFEHLSAKLPISRLQRDLTDSTVLRNIGVPFAHTFIALKSTLKGLNKLLLNETAIKLDLEKNRSVVAEAIQTILRRENYPDPYGALKALTRTNSGITDETFSDFVKDLDVPDAVKQEILAVRPENYTGM